MITLIKKELKLSLHPAVPMFLCLSSMLLIPNYPYYVTFFYITLGIFFICLSGREENDISFMLSLPIDRRDIVRARMLLSVLLEILQVMLAIPFAVLRNVILPAPNAAGMDANMALFGLVLIMLGVFNFSFFTGYYKDPAKVGVAFVVASVFTFLYVLIAESCCFIVPFFKNVLDTMGMVNAAAKIVVLIIGIIVYTVLTLAAYMMSVERFKKLDF